MSTEFSPNFGSSRLHLARIGEIRAGLIEERLKLTVTDRVTERRKLNSIIITEIRQVSFDPLIRSKSILLLKVI